MARKADTSAAQAGEQPAAGCVFMWRKDEASGAIQRAEVESVHGSVEVMAAQGWSLEPITQG